MFDIGYRLLSSGIITDIEEDIVSLPKDYSLS
jgi:hypothetical protein